MGKLYKSSVLAPLWDVLTQLMQLEVLRSFRLVGGTALSLQLGHRVSVDVDLFTDATYGNIDFEWIDSVLSSEFPIVDMQYQGNESFGKSYFIGSDRNQLVKVDLFYTDVFIRPMFELEGIRMATLEDIAAMKMEVIGHSGRKKDFWDVHELMNQMSLIQMMDYHKERYPYSHSFDHLRKKMLDFDFADQDFDPICLKGNYWELIKIDLQEAVMVL